MKTRIITALFVFLVAATAVQAGTVSRDLPDSATAGTTISVLLAVSVSTGETFYAIDEVVPSGWTVTGATGGGDFTSQAGRVKWVVITGAASTTYAYNITVPANASGTAIFGPGEYQFEGQASPSAIGGDSALPITVPPAPDFAITLNQSSLTVPRNSSRTVTATITSVAGYNQVTTLTALGVPANVTVSFNPTSSTPTFSSTVTIAASSTAALTTTVVTIKGTGADNKTHNQTLSLTVTVPPVCGNEVIEPGESCDGSALGNATCSSVVGSGSTGTLSCTSACTFNTSACSAPAPPPAAVPTCTVQQDSSTCSLASGSSGQIFTWNLSQPGKLAITFVRLTLSAAVSGAGLAIQKLPGAPAGAPTLGTAYQYFNFVPSNVPSAALSATTIGFAVNKTWLAQNNVNANTIKLNRLANNAWTALATVKTGEDSSFAYYEADSPGLSVFGINGTVTPPQCPVCPQDSETACEVQADGSGKKGVTTYVCGPHTDFQCQVQTTQQPCCPTCPPPGPYGECSPHGQQTRQIYICGDQTQFRCVQTPESRACVSREIAQAAIVQAQQAIGQANAQNRDTTAAQATLQQAEGALAQNNFEQAKSLADQARMQAQTSPERAFPLPGGPIALLTLILAAAAVAITVMVLKKKGIALRKTVNRCYIGGEETVLGLKCTVCGQRICIRHARAHNGRIYCERHVPKA